MHGMPRFMEDKVCNIHHIVDRAQTDNGQLIFQPIGTFFHFHAANGQGGVAGTGFRILNGYVDTSFFPVDLKSLDRGRSKRIGFSRLSEPGRQVARHAVMRCGIDTVGRNIYFQYKIAFNVIIFFGRHSDGCVPGKNDDAVVGVADTDFIFSANHAERFFATYFGTFDSERFITGIQNRTNGCHYDFLSGGYVRRSADDA